MSRSNPNENSNPNPSTRWFEWNGEQGTVRYYDKDQQKNVEVGSDFAFVLLDELASVRGWHDGSQSGIYSNEVRDTRQDVMIVRAFKVGTLAEGMYRDIKDRVNGLGGQFVTNCYIAFKGEDGDMHIGSIRFKGAALSAWMEFRKAHRAEMYRKGIKIKGYTEGKKGRITYRMPVLKIVELSEATDNIAKGLDAELQQYLTSYLKMNKRDQAHTVGEHVRDEDVTGDDPETTIQHITEDDIPFAWLLPLVLPVLGLLGVSQVLV